MAELFSYWQAAWLLALTATAALTDARAGVIPNWLTLPALLGALLVHAVGSGGVGLGTALASASVCAAAPLWMFARRAMGGGDVKLFAAVGALCGVRLGLELQLTTYAVALVSACAIACWQRRLIATLAVAVRIAGAAFTRNAPPCADAMTAIRLGPAALAASALVLVRAGLEATR